MYDATSATRSGIRRTEYSICAKEKFDGINSPKLKVHEYERVNILVLSNPAPKTAQKM
jgi:hypothetical protein